MASVYPYDSYGITDRTVGELHIISETSDRMIRKV